MSSSNYKVGMIVKHKTGYGVGVGKILEIQGCMLTIDFGKAGIKEFHSEFTPLEILRNKNFKAKDVKQSAFNKLHETDTTDFDQALSLETSMSEIEQEVDYFACPDKLFSPNDLQKQPPPSCSGVYGWYFDEPPPYVPKSGCTSIKIGQSPGRRKWWLLYIGQAKNLKERIVKYHIEGACYAEGTMTSLRFSLGCLLLRKLRLKLSPPPQSFGKNEWKLNSWLGKHARVAWIETLNLDAVESAAIATYTLPLNHKHNQHPLKLQLTNLRFEFRELSRSKKKARKVYFRKAYETFVEDCKRLGISK